VTLAQLLAMMWLLWELCRTEARQHRLIEVYVCGAVIAAGATLVRYAAGTQTYYRRYAAAGFDPNDLGVTVALAIPMCLYLSLCGRGAWAWRTAVAVLMPAVLLTASRAALVATFLAFLFAAWTWRVADHVQRISTIVLPGLLVLGALWLAPAPSRARLATLPHELAQGTLHNRTRIWKAGLKVLRAHPLRGIGAGAYPDAAEPWLGRPGRPGHEYVAHNTFLSVLVETGLAGFSIWSLLMAVLLVFVWVMPDTERALWYTLLAVWAAGVMTLTWEHRKPTWLLFALIATGWARSFAEKRA
jgi:O-antigen ligase